MEGLTHPAAASARRFLEALPPDRASAYEGYFSSTALRGGNMGYRCLENLRRFRSGDRLDDIDALGLAWVIRSIEAQLAAAKPAPEQEKTDA